MSLHPLGSGWRVQVQEIVRGGQGDIRMADNHWKSPPPPPLTLWTAVRASWSTRCAAKNSAQHWTPSWDFFVAMWIEVLQQWERLPVGTLPTAEVTLLILAFTSMQQTSVLQHPRVTVSTSRTPSSPRLWCPPKK